MASGTQRPTRHWLFATRLFHEQRRRMLQQALQLLDELRRVIAVDHAMIEGRRQVHHLAHDDLAALHDGPFDDGVGADDRDFGMIDDRRRDDAAQRAQARDGDGRAGKFVLAPPCRRASAAATRATSRGAAPDVARFGMAHDRHDQPVRRLRRDADMHGCVAMHDARFVVEARIDLRILRQDASPVPRMRNGSSVSFG